MSEIILKVGSKGEIYTNKELREKVGIRKEGLVKASIKDGKLVIGAIRTVEEMLLNPVIKLSPEEAERGSSKGGRHTLGLERFEEDFPKLLDKFSAMCNSISVIESKWIILKIIRREKI